MAKIAKFEAWGEPLAITQSNVLRVVKAKLVARITSLKLELLEERVKCEDENNISI